MKVTHFTPIELSAKAIRTIADAASLRVSDISGAAMLSAADHSTEGAQCLLKKKFEVISPLLKIFWGLAFILALRQ